MKTTPRRAVTFADRLARSIACCVVLVLFGCGGDAAEKGGTRIQFVDLEGLETELESYRGRGVLLNFWAIWCAPCVAELPELLEVGEEHGDEGGVVVTVSYDLMIPGETHESARSKLKAFTAEREMHVPVLVFDEADYDSINQRYQLPGQIPVTLAIDRNGAVVDRQEGAAGKARFEQMMRRALAEGS